MASFNPPHLSPLETFPVELLERIAFFAATLERHATSPALVALLCTSKRIHSRINSSHNPYLYANIFREKFDIGAVERRLGPGWMTPTNLLAELRNRCTVLSRVRRQHVIDSPSVVACDLWTIFLMLLESDGRNDVHLLENHAAFLFVQKVMVVMDALPPNTALHWLSDRQTTGLCIWILWLAKDMAHIHEESEPERDVLSYFVQPYIIAGWKYSSFYAADTHHELPLDPELHENGFATTSGGQRPPAHYIKHYGRWLTVSTPVITPAAMLVAHARYERGLGRPPAPGVQPVTLLNVIAAANGVPGQPPVPALPAPQLPAAPAPTSLTTTQLSIREYETNAHVIMPPRRDWTKDDDEPSLVHDHDWSRLVGCWDPLGIKPHSHLLKGSVYKPGMLAGSWTGTLVTPEFQGFWEAILNPDHPAHQVQWTGRPFFFRLHEHHAIAQSGIPAGLDEQDWGDDILNAWLPRTSSFAATPDELIVQHTDEEGIQRTRYATYRPKGAQHYHKRYMDLLDQICDHEGILEEGEADENDETDTVLRVGSGVQDILVTGETDGRHGDAWGHYRFIGRVRPWDGLIVLLRTPVVETLSIPDENHGRWIFRGYIHGGNFVGRWREARTHDHAARLSYEGAFVMVPSKQEF